MADKRIDDIIDDLIILSSKCRCNNHKSNNKNHLQQNDQSNDNVGPVYDDTLLKLYMEFINRSIKKK